MRFLGSRYWNPLIERNGQVLENTDGRYGPDIFGEFIRDFLERHKGKPIFVYYHGARPRPIKQMFKRSGEYLFEIIMRRYQLRSTIWRNGAI